MNAVSDRLWKRTRENKLRLSLAVKFWTASSLFVARPAIKSARSLHRGLITGFNDDYPPALLSDGVLHEAGKARPSDRPTSSGDTPIHHSFHTLSAYWSGAKYANPGVGAHIKKWALYYADIRVLRLSLYSNVGTDPGAPSKGRILCFFRA